MSFFGGLNIFVLLAIVLRRKREVQYLQMLKKNILPVYTTADISCIASEGVEDDFVFTISCFWEFCSDQSGTTAIHIPESLIYLPYTTI